MIAWQARAPKLKRRHMRVQEALQQASTNFVFSSDEAAELIKKCMLLPEGSEKPGGESDHRKQDDDDGGRVDDPSPFKNQWSSRQTNGTEARVWPGRNG